MRWLVAALVVLLPSCAALGQMTPRRLQRLADSAVKVETATTCGSGTVVGRHLVLTCEHVVHGDKAKTAMVRTLTRDGDSDVVKAEVVKVDEEHDLALLFVQSDLPPAAPVARQDAEDFSRLWEVSSPLCEDRTVSEEILSKASDRADTWRITGPSMQGSSGGGLFDEAGRLQCVFKRLWLEKDQHFAVMGQCVSRATVEKFLGR